jgi:hypothetical protein
LALIRKVFPEFQWWCDEKSQRRLNAVPLWLRNTGAIASGKSFIKMIRTCALAVTNGCLASYAKEKELLAPPPDIKSMRYYCTRRACSGNRFKTVISTSTHSKIYVEILWRVVKLSMVGLKSRPRKQGPRFRHVWPVGRISKLRKRSCLEFGENRRWLCTCYNTRRSGEWAKLKWSGAAALAIY